MIETSGLGVVRGGRAILRDVNLRIAPAQLTVLLGPSGAGKSTLLSALSGDTAAHQGEVRFDGAPLPTLSLRDLAGRRAVLPQAAGLVLPFTALEVVAFGRTPFGDGEQAARKLALAWLERLGIAHLAARSYPTLSGGERQRVQLARVLAQADGPTHGDARGAAWLLLDEPTSALDLGHQERIMRMLRARARDGAGVLVVVHDLHLAARWADAAILLADGRVVASGPAAQVITPSALAALYDVPEAALPARAVGAGPEGVNECVPA